MLLCRRPTARWRVAGAARSASPSGSSRCGSRPTARSSRPSGGLPGRLGEVQVWDVAKKKLSLSVPVTFDTVYGVSWSPDGEDRLRLRRQHRARHRRQDRRAGPVSGLAQRLGARHRLLADGSHLISVGRDMTAKLTEVATQRFVDNITSITPGALRAGCRRRPASAARRDRGRRGRRRAAGLPRLPPPSRVIGDDSNLIRELPA